MDDISSQNQRYFESGLLHRDFLNLIGILDSPNVNNGTNSTINDGLDNILGYVLISTGHLKELPYFFLYSHNGQVLSDSFFDVFWGLDLFDEGKELFKVQSFSPVLLDLLFGEVEAHAIKTI